MVMKTTTIRIDNDLLKRAKIYVIDNNIDFSKYVSLLLETNLAKEDSELQEIAKKGQALPKWLMYAYAKIWQNYQEKECTFSILQNLFPEKNKQLLLVIINNLYKYGWILVSLNQVDRRKRIYQLKHPRLIIQEIAESVIVNK